jgi:hypothetical protein
MINPSQKLLVRQWTSRNDASLKLKAIRKRDPTPSEPIQMPFSILKMNRNKLVIAFMESKKL